MSADPHSLALDPDEATELLSVLRWALAPEPRPLAPPFSHPTLVPVMLRLRRIVGGRP